MRTVIRLKDLPKTYEKLVSILPPRPIRSESQYEEVQEMIDALSGYKLNQDQADYLDALSTFFRAYEQEHYAIDTSEISAIETVQCLLEQHDMTASDLGRLLGNRALGSKILRGERTLSKEHIRKLCERFRVSADLFLNDPA